MRNDSGLLEGGRDERFLDERGRHGAVVVEEGVGTDGDEVTRLSSTHMVIKNAVSMVRRTLVHKNWPGQREGPGLRSRCRAPPAPTSIYRRARART